MTKKRGLAIAFDGPDGVGKSTQLELTAKWLRSLGYNVHTTRASGGTPIGEELRKASLSDHPRSAIVDVYISLAMHTALGEDLVNRVRAGQICLIDRSPLAIVAYNTYGSQLSDKSEGLAAAGRMFKLWQLDALLSFGADQDIINKRRVARTDKPSDYFEKQGMAYHTRVQQGYLAGIDLLEEKPELVGKVIAIDAEPKVEVIQADIQAQIKKML